ncbi:MAG: phosphatidylglycerol lysyltransferase, partial [Spirochaetales bacterium]|nr:phosphatidylglycerol lysyltransferase [Spirochaetales bacterium]
MTVYHPSTGFAIGDPDVSPLIKKPSQHDARAFFSSLILSASGWRGVFGAFDDDLGESISPSGAYAAARMALTFADYLLTQGNDASAKLVVALGIDTRPTGPAIADVMARVFLARGLAVRYAFICSAPEIMSWARRSGATPPGSPERLDAFCYVSASHNPPGHNGVKFGLVDGGVLPATITKQLIATLVDGAGSAADIDAMAELVASVDARTVSSL